MNVVTVWLRAGEGIRLFVSTSLVASIASVTKGSLDIQKVKKDVLVSQKELN
jgi:hypothetical protein